MTDKIEEIKKEAAEITKAVEKEEYNKEEVLKGIKEIITEQMDALKKPVMDKNFNVPEDKAHVLDGKYAGVKKTDLYFTNMLIDSINHVADPSNRIKKSIDLEKAMTAAGAGAGDEWVTTAMNTEIWTEWQKRSLVADKIDIMDMPSDPFDIPIMTGDTTLYLGSEAGTPTASDVTTAKKTLTACKLIGKNLMSYELEEDAIFAVQPKIKENFTKQIAAAVDSVILNGDETTGTSNINLSGGAIGATSRFLCDDGMRHAALIDNAAMDADLGALATADFDTLLALMGKYATRPSENVIFTDVWTYLKIIALSDVLTIDKYGNDATIIKGELAKLKGMPIVVSEELAKSNATGHVDNSAGNNTKGQIVIAHTPSWQGGFKRRLLIETDRDIDLQQYEIVASIRFALVGYGTMSGQTHTAVGFNITV